MKSMIAARSARNRVKGACGVTKSLVSGMERELKSLVKDDLSGVYSEDSEE